MFYLQLSNGVRARYHHLTASRAAFVKVCDSWHCRFDYVQFATLDDAETFLDDYEYEAIAAGMEPVDIEVVCAAKRSALKVA